MRNTTDEIENPFVYAYDTRQLECFLVLAEELHFGHAADRLAISQPGLSKHIKRIEQDLGVQLFDRSNRRVKLTAAGRYFQRVLRPHLTQFYQYVRHMQLIDAGARGELRVGYVGSAMESVIPDLLRRLDGTELKLRFHLQELSNQQQLDALLTSELDIGFVRSVRIPTGLEKCVVLRENFCLVLPADHPLSPETFTSLSQVSEEPFILFDQDYSTSYYEQVMHLFDRAGFVPKVSHKTIHASSIYNLVELGLGLSIVPLSLTRGYRRAVKFIELANAGQQTKLFAVWNPENHNPALRRIMELMDICED